ncbi:MAG: hypothetical protein ACFE9T_16600, partial [Promethearchaeota archaeon]
MRKEYKSRNFVLGLIFISFFLLSLSSSVKFSYAQDNGDTLNLSSKFNLIELADNINTSKSISSLEFPLPSTSWNITNIEMNFTDIKLGKEIKDIEVEGKSISTIDSRDKLGYGVELNITEPTTLFGVYIYGYLIGTPVLPVYVQIQGYNGITDAPDENVIRSTLINMTDPGWHQQTFEKDITLTSGRYYLVINGSELTFPTDRSEYNWIFNGSGSVHNNLHTAVYEDGIWAEENIGKPFLHKLIQRVDRAFTPDEINMTLDIDGSLYPVSGNGSVIMTESISPNSDIFNIPIYNNRSIELLFNLSYHLELQNILISEGSVLIQENSANSWTLEPEISRCFCNYSIEFHYPKNWFNLTIFRNNGVGWENITADIIKDPINQFIFLPDITIIEGADWKITANSPNFEPSLDVPKSKFSGGQEIQFSVLSPIFPGNITFRMINPLGNQDQLDIIYVLESAGNLLLSFQLPSNPNDGFYTAYVFWNNATDAGVISQKFKIAIPFVLDPMLVVIIASAIAILAIASFATVKLVKSSKRKHEAYRQSIFNKYMDVLNLEYFIVTHKTSGLNIYEQILAGKSIDASLIAGFLEAIRSFGIELTGAGEQSQTIKLEYQDSKILMSEFKSFRILLIMKESPSQDFLESIKNLSYDIDSRYGYLIKKFNGNIK